MPQPSQNEVHVDRPLTNISVAYMQAQRRYIATQAFPVVPVENQSDKYFTYTKNDWFRDEAQKRADGDESAGGGYNLSTSTYSCDVWAYHKDVGQQARANSDAPLNPDRDATTFVTNRLLIRQELQWVSDYFTTSVWDTDATPSNLWSDYTSSDPITDIETAKEQILSTTGFMPNTLILGYQVYRQLKHHPDVVDRYKYTGAPATGTPDILAQLFDVGRVLVASSIKATNKEGGTAAYSFAHGKHALLCFSAPNPGLLTPSAGYVFTWRGVSDGLGTNIGISRMYMQEKRSDRIEGQIAFDNKVIASDMGYFFNGAVA